MAGYIRQSSFIDGDTITAALFNNEYNQLVNAFSNTSGHKHDGTTAEGPVIGLIGDAGETSPNNKVLIDTTNNYIEFYVEVASAPVQQLYIADGAIIPVTDSDIDLGTTSLRFKDTYTDTVTTTGNVSIGGDLTVTGSATISGNLTFGDADTDSINLAAEIDSDIIPNTDGTYDLGSATKEWQDLYIDGTANIDSLVADTADINGGTIDGATIATSDITVGAGKTLNVSAGTLTLADNQISGDKVEGGTIAATTITTLTSTTGNITNVNATTVDSTNLEVTNLKAKDGTSAGSIADSTGVVTLASSVLTTTDINGGTIDGATIATSDITVGTGKTLDVSSGTLTLADNQISGDKVEGGTIAATTITALTYGSLSDGTITITAFADEDDMSSDSATLVPTQQSVKAYVDSQVTAQDLDFQGDSGGALSIDLDSETLTIAGGTGIDTTGATNTLTVAIDSTVATLTGSQTLTNKTLTTPVISSISNTGTLTLPTSTDTLVGRATTDTLTNKTLTSPVLNTGVSGTAILDEDNMASDSATQLATQQSIKAYVDAEVGAIVTDVVSDTTPQLGGDLASNGNDILFADTDKAIFGTGSDLQIFHTGSSSVITDTGTGDLKIRANNLLLEAYATEDDYLTAIDGGAVTIFYDGSAKLATTSTGIDVTGTVVADGLTVDTSTLVVDSTNNRVGIGITSPQKALDIAGASSGGGAVMRLSGTGEASEGDVTGAIQFYSADTTDNTPGVFGMIRGIAGASGGEGSLQILTDMPSEGADANNITMHFNANGKVGIGTSSPSYKTDIQNSGDNILQTTGVVSGGVTALNLRQSRGSLSSPTNSSTNGDGNYIVSQIYRDAGYNSNAWIGLVTDSATDDGRIIFGTASSGTVAEKMRIDSSGKVAIGDTSAGTYQLKVDSGSNGTSDALAGIFVEGQRSGIVYNLVSNNTANAANRGSGIQFRSGGFLTSGIVGRSDAIAASGDAPGYLTFHTSTDNSEDFAERMRIDSSGNATFNHSVNITGDLNISSTIAHTGDLDTYLQFNDANTFRIVTAGSERIRVGSDGNVGIGHTDANVKLDVNGAIRTRNSSSAILYLSNLSTQYAIQNNGNDLTIGRDGTERMRIESAGNLLVGTTTSEGKLTVEGDASAGQFTALALKQDAVSHDQGSSMTCDMDFYLWDNNTRISTPQARIGVIGDATADQNYEAGGQLCFYTNIRSNTSPSLTERMRIDADGSIGIGTTDTSNAKLVFNGNVSEGSDTAIMDFDGYGTYGSNASQSINFRMGRTGQATDQPAQIVGLFEGGGATSAATHIGFVFKTISANTQTDQFKIDAAYQRFKFNTSESPQSSNPQTNNCLVIGPSTSTAVTQGLTNATVLINRGGELYAVDSSHNNTQLTPHNWTLIPDGPSEELAWTYWSQRPNPDNPDQLQSINVDIAKVARKVEDLVGEKLVYTENSNMDDHTHQNIIADIQSTLADLTTRIEALEG